MLDSEVRSSRMTHGISYSANSDNTLQLTQRSQELYSLIGNRSHEHKDDNRLKMIKHHGMCG